MNRNLNSARRVHFRCRNQDFCTFYLLNMVNNKELDANLQRLMFITNKAKFSIDFQSKQSPTTWEIDESQSDYYFHFPFQHLFLFFTKLCFVNITINDTHTQIYPHGVKRTHRHGLLSNV